MGKGGPIFKNTKLKRKEEKVVQRKFELTSGHVARLAVSRQFASGEDY
jgi:hypothetical protein